MVPADGEVTSQTAIGGNAYHGPAAFATTHWSVVLEAQGESPAAQEALEKLCRIYWRPIYSFVRRQEAGPEEAQDLQKTISMDANNALAYLTLSPVFYKKKDAGGGFYSPRKGQQLGRRI